MHGLKANKSRKLIRKGQPVKFGFEYTTAEESKLSEGMKRELANWALASLAQQHFPSSTHTVVTPPDDVVNDPRVASSLVVPKAGGKPLLIQYPVINTSTLTVPNTATATTTTAPTTPTLAPAAPPSSPDVRVRISQQLDEVDQLCDGLISHPSFDHLVIRGSNSNG